MNCRFFALLLLIPLISAQLNITEIGEMKARLDINWSIHLEGDVDRLNFTVYAPINDSNQQLLSISSSHPYALIKDGKNLKLFFSFEKPGNELNISTSFLIKTNYQDEKITATTGFPFEAKMGEETELTAYNDDIKKKADEVAGGKRDALEVLAALDEWVHNNIEYNISYAELELPATAVYGKRQGTCDEYAHLLISFGRAVGIPISFVSGYVNSGEEWAPHAWVEADVPGVGLIQLDPTYNEASFLDATHIRIATEADQSKVSDKVNAVGPSVAKITTEKNYGISILETKNFERWMGLNVTTEEIDKAHEAVDVTIKNERNEHIFVPLKIYPTAGLTVDEDEHMVYLPPFGEEKVRYVLTLPALKENSIYSFPIRVETLGEKSDITFKRTTAVATGNATGNETGGGKEQVAVCGPALLLLCALLFSSKR